jgi:hypothetical protein
MRLSVCLRSALRVRAACHFYRTMNGWSAAVHAKRPKRAPPPDQQEARKGEAALVRDKPKCAFCKRDFEAGGRLLGPFVNK